MVDRVSVSKRSAIMSRIRGKDTAPELAIRRLVYSEGYRYRLHVKKLPGQPDLVFPMTQKVIFVHGCFWHMHPNCPKGRPPKSKLDYWVPKLEENRRRDLRNERELRKKGWRILVVWQCELKDIEKLKRRILNFLDKG
jgi:DNA mismatch endonuclease, patch repair protein